eukprot:scaffold14736_cov260-Skeletonema_menzelii.AAC.3
MYHPDSGVDTVTSKMESWFQSVLEKAYNFRLGLLPQNSGLKASDCPPIAVLRGDHCDTEFSYNVRRSSKSIDKGSYLDLKEGIGHLRGDGRVTLQDTLPPKGIPVCKIVTNAREHTERESNDNKGQVGSSIRLHLILLLCNLSCQNSSAFPDAKEIQALVIRDDSSSIISRLHLMSDRTLYTEEIRSNLPGKANAQQRHEMYRGLTR